MNKMKVTIKGDRVKELMLAYGLNEASLANSIGSPFSKALVCDIVQHDRKRYEVESARKLAKTLNTSQSYLSGDSDNPGGAAAEILQRYRSNAKLSVPAIDDNEATVIRKPQPQAHEGPATDEAMLARILSYAQFPDRMNEILRAYQLSADEFSTLMGHKRHLTATIDRWCHGTAFPTPKYLREVASTIGVNEAVFMQGLAMPTGEAEKVSMPQQRQSVKVAQIEQELAETRQAVRIADMRAGEAEKLVVTLRQENGQLCDRLAATETKVLMAHQEKHAAEQALRDVKNSFMNVTKGLVTKANGNWYFNDGQWWIPLTEDIAYRRGKEKETQEEYCIIWLGMTDTIKLFGRTARLFMNAFHAYMNGTIEKMAAA